jgi:hypothetical protein
MKLAQHHNGCNRLPPVLVRGAAAISVCLLAVACGGHSPASVAHLGRGSQTTQASPLGGSTEQFFQQALSYSKCMRAHGDVAFPDPILFNNGHAQAVTMGTGSLGNSAGFQSANVACRHLLPQGSQGPSLAEQQRVLNEALRFARCMRLHGVPNFPDPILLGGGAIRISAGIDPHSPAYQAAQRACRSLSPVVGQ